MEAVKKDNIPIAKLLLEHGAKADVVAVSAGDDVHVRLLNFSA